MGYHAGWSANSLLATGKNWNVMFKLELTGAEELCFGTEKSQERIPDWLVCGNMPPSACPKVALTFNPANQLLSSSHGTTATTKTALTATSARPSGAETARHPAPLSAAQTIPLTLLVLTSASWYLMGIVKIFS